MAVGIPTTKTAFDAQKQTMAVDAVTKAYQRLDIAQANASRTAATFADATGRGRITLENFGRTFDNATRKVLIWQLAIMAVYGTIRKLGETIQIWRDFEVTLARISITTEALGSKLQQYFMQVADVAIRFVHGGYAEALEAPKQEQIVIETATEPEPEERAEVRPKPKRKPRGRKRG